MELAKKTTKKRERKENEERRRGECAGLFIYLMGSNQKGNEKD